MIRRIDGIEAIAGAKENDFYCMVVEKGKSFLYCPLPALTVFLPMTDL